jgi:nicotinamide mononucleotide transporter
MLEISAIVTTAICIFLAGRNNVNTWWIGIVACILFGVLFYQSQLYADVTLQVFFVITGFIGWYNWSKKTTLNPISKTPIKQMLLYASLAIVVAFGYGYILHLYTDAYAPFIDSLVLTGSVLAQLLLMKRKVENWPIWLLVNTLSVPLYYNRELYVTSAMYAIFWINAAYSWYHWNQLMKQEK